MSLRTAVRPRPLRQPPHRQAGLTLVELMVAITIGLIVMLAFTVIFLNMKRSFTDQDQLAQLQDSERLALTVLTNAVQSAGYVPDAWTSGSADLLAASTNAVFGNMAARQAVVGTTSSTGDTLTVRFVAGSNDGLMDCLGQANTGTTSAVMTAIFAVNTTKELTCSTNPAANGSNAADFTPLVSNVSSFQVSYLVDMDPTMPGSSSQYMSAADVEAASKWMSVRVLRVTLVFANPYAGQAGQPDNITWVQSINLMNQVAS